MRSMTAYAHVYKRKNSQTFHLVLRSLNYKYLDISIRGLLPENIILEELIKKEISKKIYRGKIEVYLFYKNLGAANICINTKILDEYILNAKILAEKYNLDFNPKITDFLNLPQVIFTDENAFLEQNLIISLVKEGLKKLLVFKEHEGLLIKKQMVKNLEKLKANILEIKKRLKTKKVNIDTNNKDDIDEEISLGLFYVKKLEKNINLKKDEPIGKSLDFLTQEILRELNSASSKITDKDFALLLVDAKKYVDRIREQAQNIE